MRNWLMGNGEAMAMKFNRHERVILVVTIVSIISMMHFFTLQSKMYRHIFYRGLYFFPLILAGFWFGMRGSLFTGLSITILYLPFTVMHWQNFSPNDLNRLVEIALYNIVGIILGILRDLERRREKEKLEGILAMAGGVAHELNTPLCVALVRAQMIQRGLDTGTQEYQGLQLIIKSLKRMSQSIEQIAKIDKPEFKQYVGNSCIVDIEKSSRQDEFHQSSLQGGK